MSTFEEASTAARENDLIKLQSLVSKENYSKLVSNDILKDHLLANLATHIVTEGYTPSGFTGVIEYLVECGASNDEMSLVQESFSSEYQQDIIDGIWGILEKPHGVPDTQLSDEHNHSYQESGRTFLIGQSSIPTDS